MSFYFEAVQKMKIQSYMMGTTVVGPTQRCLQLKLSITVCLRNAHCFLLLTLDVSCSVMIWLLPSWSCVTPLTMLIQKWAKRWNMGREQTFRKSVSTVSCITSRIFVPYLHHKIL